MSSTTQDHGTNDEAWRRFKSLDANALNAALEIERIKACETIDMNELASAFSAQLNAVREMAKWLHSASDKRNSTN